MLDLETVRKIKILNTFHLVFIMSAPLLGLFYFYIGAILLFYTTIISGLLMISSMILLRKTKHLVWIGNYAIFILWATLFVIAWLTGAISYEGVIRPSWILNGGLILLAIFLNGYLWGTIWATLVFVETGVVIYLFRIGYQFPPSLIPLEISATYSLGSFFLSLLMILLFAFLFENERNEALRREQEKSQTIRESKRYIDDILERSPIPTFILDGSHRVIQWNHACQEMTGITAGEILGKGVGECFDIDDQGSVADIILKNPDFIEENYGDSILSKTANGWFELEMFLPKLKGGLQTVITAATISDNNGKIKGAIQTIQEKKAVQNKRGIRRDDLLDETEDSFPGPIFRVDPQGKISFWNKACEGILGYTSSQMIGKQALTLVPKRYRPLFREAIVRALKGEFLPDKEWGYQNSEKRPVYVLATVYPSQSADGKDKECVIFNTDITNLKSKLKKLGLYAAESKERLKNLSEEYDLLKKNIATFIRKKD